MPSKRVKERRKKRKRQSHINTQLKKRLFGHLFIAPCCYCKDIFFIDELTIEHIIPRSLGGTNDDNNIALACAPCNHAKGKEAWMLKREALRKQYEQYPTEHCSEGRPESLSKRKSSHLHSQRDGI